MKNYKQRCQRLIRVSLLIALLSNLILPASALAWKPITHVYLADIAVQDALDDGYVTIQRVDYKQGQIIGVIGQYAVDPDILAALQNNAPQYRAGLLGPDAYLDILTGQLIIHPDAAETGVAGGPDAWLRYLWAQSNTPPYNTSPIKAFTVGFLTHAAGEHISLRRFNNEYLHINDTGYNDENEFFDYRQVPAAYNSVTMSKLVLQGFKSLSCQPF